MKTVLLIGSGGREHALAWKLAQSSKVSRLILVPGSDAIFSNEPKKIRVDRHFSELKTHQDFNEVVELSRKEKVDLVVVGPELPLSLGLGDVLREAQIPVFGPNAAGARMEASKAFAKEIMTEAGVPTAKYIRVQSQVEAEQFLRQADWSDQRGWVIKADGLAGGKGVVVCDDLDSALDATQRLIEVSDELVIEEKLVGEELSWMAFCDRRYCSLLEPARDFKRLYDGQKGPNTGGMGAYSPVQEVNRVDFEDRVRHQVFEPILRELSRRGIPFQGMLYAGLMWNPKTDHFSVLEFNVRFGDPEAQALLLRMDGDFYDWCEAVALGQLDQMPSRVPFKKEAAVVVVGAAPGYPEAPEKEIPISADFQNMGIEKDQPTVFWAGVKKNSKGWVTSGGRVFCALGQGSVLEEARWNAYQQMEFVRFAGKHFRKDIARS